MEGNVLTVVKRALARERLCPARGRTCDQCREIGQFKVKCRTRPSRDSQQGQKQGTSHRSWRDASGMNEKGRKINMNYVDGDADTREGTN